MIRTGIPADIWADQGWRVIYTALELLDEHEQQHDTAERGQRSSTWASG